MATFLIILIILTGIMSIIGTSMYFRSRGLLREQKNFERGLKMVPLLIHLPPISEDTEGNGRDVRDVIDENISKAQIVYGIIASTLQKGFRSKFYGQRHFGFEIIGTHGFVKFYAAVPVSLVEVVKQAVISAYPSAQLEEVAEHNIFSPVGRISGTVGGELSLKENYAYPIATYQEIKRDTLQSLLNSLSTLEKEDGAGIQILIRPADPVWRKNAAAVAASKRKGKDKKGNELAWWGKQLFLALVKPPEAKEGEKKDDKPELSSLDQAILDAIDDKTRYPGYEVLIRLVASSGSAPRAQAILNNVVAAFSLFDAPGKNGFSFTSSKDIDNFVTAYILRMFPQESNQNILNAVELATLFHFPDQRNIPTSQLERQTSKQVDGPRNMPDEGLLLGYNVFRGTKRAIRLALGDRQRHMYVVGQTGTGKSTFLENLALQDMLNGDGLAFIDPHGDVAERLLSMVPKERTEDVIYFSPADMDYPMGLNLFEFQTPDQRDFLIQEAINMLYKLYDPQHQGIMGPRYEHMFRNLALTVMSNPAGGTFIDIPKLFTDKEYERQLKSYITDPTVLDFWNKEMAQTADFHKSEVMGWFVAKFGAFLNNEMMRNIIGQTKSAFDLRDVMDNKKILLVNLSKGRTGELNSKLLGMVFVMKFQAAAMSRANIPEEERKDFCLYVDEFQNFSTDSFANIMSEARKYHLNLIVANQFTTQLTEEIRDAVFGNMGTIVSFRVGQGDVEALSRYFQPLFEADDLLRVPNHNTVVRTLIGGVPTQPFSMATLPPLGTPNKELADALKQLSAAKFGKPKAVVEKAIFGRLTSKEAPKPGLNAPPSALNQPGSNQRPPVRPGPGGASFLDEWLAKRQSAPPLGVPAARPVGSPPPTGVPAQAAFTRTNPGLPVRNVPTSPVTAIPPPVPTPQPQTTTNTNIQDNNRPEPVNELTNKIQGAPPSPSPIQPPLANSQAGEVKLNDNTPSSDQAEDTIYIDQEGNLRPK
ncbi:MAG: ATP-binding protein [Candidatus Paceibacterota bacterium]|jgi:hypothetical protein